MIPTPAAAYEKCRGAAAPGSPFAMTRKENDL